LSGEGEREGKSDFYAARKRGEEVGTFVLVTRRRGKEKKETHHPLICYQRKVLSSRTRFHVYSTGGRREKVEAPSFDLIGGEGRGGGGLP